MIDPVNVKLKNMQICEIVEMDDDITIGKSI